MSTSPVSPEDVRAAAEVHAELGPEYSDAVVAAFLAEVDRQVAARVEAQLASTPSTQPAGHESRWSLLKGMAIGVFAGALTVAGIGLAVPRASSSFGGHTSPVAPTGRPGSGPMQAHLLPYLRHVPYLRHGVPNMPHAIPARPSR